MAVVNKEQYARWLGTALGLPDGETPFPWQERLLEDFLAGKPPMALDIPTGLGKTAVMAVWLVARALQAPLPRRLVYVVDRRAVVDQATEVAEALCAWVAKERGVANALGLDDRPLPISTLRGQHVDNRAWLEDPSSPAIIVGTVDMVGSRLLFSGYGVSPKMRPYHAGLLGADTLVVLDEAHLVPAFEDLLRQVERGVASFGPNEPQLRALVPPFKLLALSATGRQTDATTLTLSDVDRSNPIVKKRLTARKALSIVDLANTTDAAATAAEGKSVDDADELHTKDKGSKLASVLAKQAWAVTTHGSAKIRCLVFCDARKDATAIAAELRSLAKSATAPEPAIELFVGGRRVRERTQARDGLARLGFLAGAVVNLERSAFLIATSAGEVGVDLDADHMVCDLVAWERMVQRLGRVNRRGDGDSKVVVVVEARTPDEETLRSEWESCRLKDKFPKEQKRTLDLFDKRKRAMNARAKLKEEHVSAADRKVLKSQVSAFKDAEAKKLAVYEAEIAKHKALRKLLDTVAEGGSSLSPDALLMLRSNPGLAAPLRDATTVERLRPELTRPLVDAWSMTSLDEHPGRPEVDPWLRGFRPNDPPRTTVVWRRHLPVRADGSFDAKAAKRFFEAAPPHTSEQLETETRLVLDWLVGRAAAKRPEPSKSVRGLLDKRSAETDLTAKQQNELADYETRIRLYDGRPQEKGVVAMLLSPRGEVRGWRKLEDLKIPTGDEGKRARKGLEELLIGATLVIDARLGGLADGLLNDKADAVAAASDDGSTSWVARPDAAGVPVTGFRIRVLGSNEEDDSA